MNEAAKPNPALEPLEVLVGQWKTTGTHPLFPAVTFHGSASFEWIEGGAFLMMRSAFDEDGIPSATAVFGSDDAKAQCFMLYFDERGVSRKYEIEILDNRLKWWRNAPGFSQRLTGEIVDNGRTINGVWELSKDGAAWEEDLRVSYTRAD